MSGKLIYTTALAVMTVLFTNGAVFAQPGRLTGTVRSGFEALPAANISVAGQTGTSDENGRFAFTLTPGNYIIVVTHTGYKKLESAVTIEAGKEIHIELKLIVNELLEELTVLGSKTGTERSTLSTAVPVDVISSERLSQTGHPSVIQMLFHSLPSLNAERQKLAEPVTYRGLDPHHLLILLNNTRYHNAAWLNNGVPKSDLGRGSTSNDLGTIPFAAIEKVEVLRDGASAQYGSDAIAAVMNIRLKESTGQARVYFNNGQYYAGDGFKSWIGIYKGFPLRNRKVLAGKPGFLSLSAELRTQAPTSRVRQYTGLVYYNYTNGMSEADRLLLKAKDDSTILANGIDRSIFTKNSGTAKLNSYGILINGSYPLKSRTSVFWTGTVNHKKVYAWGNYRYPNDPARVNTLLHPNGFKPINANENLDATAIAGIKGMTRGEWSWDFSSSYGYNGIRVDVTNSNNASQYAMLGSSAPTAFHLGKYVYHLLSNNISFSKDLVKNGSNWRSANLIVGAEWRFENYKLKAGDEAAYTDYDGAGPRQAGSQPSIGSVSRSDAVNSNRSASSVYVSWEAEPDERLLLDVAARYEYYSDFGGNLAGKLAARHKLSPRLSIRGSVGNGYRAPGLQQRYFSGLQSFRGTTQIQRVFNNGSPVTKAFHIPSLTAERTVNLSLGITSRISPSLSLTLDGYLISIKNRIVLSGVFRRTDPQVNAILVDHPGVDLVQFYTNAINTRTYGIDAVINGNWKIRQAHIGVTIAANLNRHSIFGSIKTTDVVTNISNYTNTLFGIEERTTLMREQPGEKIIASVNVSAGKFSFTLRNTYFGSTGTATLIGNPVDTVFQRFSPRVLTDFGIVYNAKSWITIAMGANNMFNVFPDRLQNPTDGISLYSNGAIPYGTNGGYYYLNMRFTF